MLKPSQTLPRSCRWRAWEGRTPQTVPCVDLVGRRCAVRSVLLPPGLPPLGRRSQVPSPAGEDQGGGGSARDGSIPHSPAETMSAVHAAAPHTGGMNILPGRAQPSHTLPPGGGMGKPGFPIPLRKGCALTFPGAGRGKTRFPHTPHRGLMFTLDLIHSYVTGGRVWGSRSLPAPFHYVRPVTASINESSGHSRGQGMTRGLHPNGSLTSLIT